MRKQVRWNDVNNYSVAHSGDLKFTPEQVRELGKKLVGEIVLPQNTSYAESRESFANAVQRFPQIIVYCEGPADVVACIHFAKEVAASNKENFKPVCRSGGHSTAGYSVNDDMVIDVSRMNYVKVDSERAAAWIGAGARFAQVNAELELFGFHIPGGGCETVSVSGYMQGGGYGFTSPMFGMNCDQVTSFQMALADGRIVTASEKVNQDLFWAVRGGTGNNFGVLLEIEYRLQPMQELWGFGFTWPIASEEQAQKAAVALHAWQNHFTGDALPPKLGNQGMLIHTQAFPKKTLGPVFMIRGMYSGTEAECRKTLSPLFNAIPDAKSHRDVWRKGTYSELNTYLFNYPTELPPNIPNSVRSLAKSHIVSRQLTSKESRAIIEFYRKWGSPMDFVGFEAYGGAINAVARDANAFWHRDAAMDAFFFALWLYENEKLEAETKTRQFDDVLGQVSNGHSYQNYPNQQIKDFGRVYFGGNLERLLKVKKIYDPGNLFTFPQGLGQLVKESNKRR